MPKKENLFFVTILVLGILDWLTTIVGVAFFDASEQNLILANLVHTNLFIFSMLKLSTVLIVALCIFKGTNLCKYAVGRGCTKMIFNMCYLITATSLLTVVSNNLLAITA
jgi:hypothetical protein